MVAQKPRVVVVGAGVAGLTAAHRLCAAGGDRFEVTVVEAAPRAGGRVHTSEFAGHRVEMGATWIQGIDGSPVYALARDAGALARGKDDEDLPPYERMDGFPDRVLTVAEGGEVFDADLVARPIQELYRGMMEAARAGEPIGARSGVEEYLRRGLRAYQAARASGGAGLEMEGVEDALLAMHINRERTDTSADELGDLDLAAEAEYRDFPGEHVTVPGGYSRVVDRLVAALPPGTVRLGLRLRRLDWSDTPVRLHLDDGASAMVIAADHVILTVSLGVLKDAHAAGGIAFHPPLPQFKRDAVARLGFGVVNKLFMELEAVPAAKPEGASGAGDHPIAASAPQEFPFLHMAFRGHVSEIPWWMRRTESICPVHAGSRVALAWFAGREAEHLESLPDGEVIRGVHATLDSFLPAPATSRWRVKRVKRSGWATDPLFLGSYSYVAVGSSGEDLDRMAEPLPRGSDADADVGRAPPLRVLFAGEATHRTHYSTTHAAYLSGVREAERLLQHYG